MRHRIHRRDFFRTSGALGAAVGLSSCFGSRLPAAEVARGAPHAETLGWRLGVQAWSFHSRTFFDAIDKTASLGLHYIEAIPRQPISDQLTTKMGPGLTADARKEVMQKLGDSGIRLVNYGVGGFDRAHFDFAKEMGIETLVAEPPEGAFEEIDKLCSEYEINLAIHNHPKPSPYWNPDTVLRVCQGRSKRIGACADTGHWPRSGLNALECLKKLEGRLITFHFKDLSQLGPAGHDVPWGTGLCDAKGMLAEIHRQGVKAVFSIEYEYNWDNSLPDMAQCVAFFDKTAAELAGVSLALLAYCLDGLLDHVADRLVFILQGFL